VYSLGLQYELIEAAQAFGMSVVEFNELPCNPRFCTEETPLSQAHGVAFVRLRRKMQQTFGMGGWQ
jgi:hypothetical protein